MIFQLLDLELINLHIDVFNKVVIDIIRGSLVLQMSVGGYSSQCALTSSELLMSLCHPFTLPYLMVRTCN